MALKKNTVHQTQVVAKVSRRVKDGLEAVLSRPAWRGESPASYIRSIIRTIDSLPDAQDEQGEELVAIRLNAYLYEKLGHMAAASGTTRSRALRIILTAVADKAG